MNLNSTIVALFSIEEGESLSFKASKLRNNIRNGRVVDPLGDIPEEYVPNFAALHNEEEAMGADAFAVAWAEFEKRRQNNYDALVDLWEKKDYAGMVKVMEEADG